MAEIGASRGDQALIAALAAGKSILDAAALAGLSPRTATRRMADPAFRQLVSVARGQVLDRAIGMLALASTDAAQRLSELLKASDERVALGAAKAILETGAKLRESGELEQRVAAIEERLAEQPKSVHGGLGQWSA